MKLTKDGHLWYFKWHMVVIYVVVIVLLVLAVFTDLFMTNPPGMIPQAVWLLGAIVVIIALIVMLQKVMSILASIQETNEKLEKISASLEKSRAVLSQLHHDTKLSEKAKTVAFRDSDRQALREVVYDKLQQQDFNAAFEIIDEIEHSAGYQPLAEQLRSEAGHYQGATNQDRVKQVIANIEKLLENHQWTKASLQIERLIADQPESEEAKRMRQKLVTKKEERKKILLRAWDDAINRQATDRGLEILRELDMYLTPNEASALEEAARDVFRNKLHSLGVRFSLAVTGKEWENAIETAQEIIRDFPNSKMAHEIRDKIDILKRKADAKKAG